MIGPHELSPASLSSHTLVRSIASRRESASADTHARLSAVCVWCRGEEHGAHGGGSRGASRRPRAPGFPNLFAYERARTSYVQPAHVILLLIYSLTFILGNGKVL